MISNYTVQNVQEVLSNALFNCHRPLSARFVEEGICNACLKRQSRHYQRDLEGAASILDITGSNFDEPLLTMTCVKETA